MLVKMRRPSGEWPMPMRTISCAGTLWMGLSSNVISPVRERNNPLMVLRRVLLPAPFDPMIDTISPASTLTDTSLRA